MYFSEFLETCTIGWASFCEGGVGDGKESAFFILVGEDGTHRPHPGLRPYSPRVTPAHPDGLHTTGGRAGRAGTIGQGAGRWTACATCPIGHAQTDKIIVNKNIYFLCVNPLTKEIKLFTI